MPATVEYRCPELVGGDFSVVGLLDWELAGSGPGEMDVAWFCEMNRMRSIGMGIEPLPGFHTESETWDCWSDTIGRRPAYVEWHHRYAAYRVAVLMFLFLRAAIIGGRLPANHRLLQDNTSTRRLADFA